MKNYFKKYLIIFLSIFVILIILYYLPSLIITEENQTCIVSEHCKKIDCSLYNEKLNEKDLVNYSPMCINYKCKCEWYGNLLHLK